MNRKFIIGAVVGALVLAGGSFYAGTVIAKSQAPGRGGFAAGQFGGAGSAGGRTRTGGGFAGGEVLSKDATSVTIKLASGSTQIVLMGTSTQILKSAVGTLNDLSVGTNIVVTGQSNSDGSVTAQSIQVRPAGMGPGGASAR